MSFWTKKTFEKRAKEENLIQPFDPDRVEHSSYELSLGNEYFLTSDDPPVKKVLEDGEQLSIPPGQFALLLSMEKVSVPLDALGFISIKAGIKFKGLVNVSGFHVDPGFSGQLKFSVYNAGVSTIILDAGKPYFLLWFAKLDEKLTKGYEGSHQDQKGISGKDVMDLQGMIPSPHALEERIKKLENWFKVIARLLIILGGIILTALFARYLYYNIPQPQTQQPLPNSPHTQSEAPFPSPRGTERGRASASGLTPDKHSEIVKQEETAPSKPEVSESESPPATSLIKQ